MALTAQDIGRQIQQSREPLSAAVDRLRNWTKMGIISPIGDRHPGTGRKKRYSPMALVEAILIQALTDGLGAPATSLRPIINKIPRLSQIAAAAILEPYQHPSGKQEPAEVLIISRSPTTKPHALEGPGDVLSVGTADYIHVTMSKVRSAVHIVIDLRVLFARLPEKWEQSLKGEVLEWARKIATAKQKS